MRTEVKAAVAVVVAALSLILLSYPLGDTAEKDPRIWRLMKFKYGQEGLLINQTIFPFVDSFASKRICIEGSETVLDYFLYDTIPRSSVGIQSDVVVAQVEGEVPPAYYLITNNTKWVMNNITRSYHYGIDPLKVVTTSKDFIDLFPTTFYF